MRPDFKKFRGVGLMSLTHSAKGSTWEEHKYIKRIDGTYYYPDDYEGGRHLSDADVEKLADETYRGNFGNGQTRKDLLGEDFQQIQDRVNEKYYGIGSTRLSDVPEEKVKAGEKLLNKAVSSSSSKGLDMETIYSVYRKKG